MKTERERHEHIYTLFGSLLDLYKEERGSFRDSVNSGAYKTIWSGFAIQSYIFVADNSLYCGDKGKEEEVALFYAFVLNLLYFLGPF